ncbi:MAG: M20/M25/M40 family metallo-hydrolase [Desulfuromonadales bacterium]|nr:M20/M25/M40 family metallo-hydrolase [Desulfuromonadales bacterium]NIR33556.1 M20/M25/M40 family metallo-hydrolase [Desulfuromonadales bacterium]NIS41146.1 M20/M25/M40 family metallo-hydrolase [Desulfuromonadales bacterium]
MIILTLILLIAVLLAATWFSKRYRTQEQRAPLSAPLGNDEAQAAKRLQRHVQMLAGTIGERNMWHFERLEQAAGYIEGELKEAGCPVRAHEYTLQGKTARNIVAELAGSERPEEIVVVGAHYDSVMGSPGANDNATGVAALLELGRSLCDERPRRTLRLAAFVNEEPPFFKTHEMGSRVYAKEARQRGEKIVAMVSLETIGYYSDAEESQMFPFPPLRFFYPTRGNFVAFVSNFRSRALLQRSLKGFRAATDFPAEGLAAPEWLIGVDWSDQWSFWRSGYPAIMITDTAPFRYRHYHTMRDTPDKVDYGALARVKSGLVGMVRGLAGSSELQKQGGRR